MQLMQKACSAAGAQPRPRGLALRAEARCEQYGIRSLRLRHVRGDPRSRSEMQRLLDVTRFKAAIVVCGGFWGRRKGVKGPRAHAPPGCHIRFAVCCCVDK